MTTCIKESVFVTTKYVAHSIATMLVLFLQMIVAILRCRPNVFFTDIITLTVTISVLSLCIIDFFMSITGLGLSCMLEPDEKILYKERFLDHYESIDGTRSLSSSKMRDVFKSIWSCSNLKGYL